jgi:Zn-dependent protease/predicted transcriptional regulator
LESRNGIKNKIAGSIGNALHIGTYYGIPVRVHWTFGVLLLFILYTIVSNKDLKLWQGIAYLLVFLTTFLCVILHEYGHALTGKKFGIKTHDIIMSPLGGLARMSSMAEKPMHEFFITIAGPLVNLSLGVFIGLVMYFITGKWSMNQMTYDFDKPEEFVRLLMPINLYLFLFNLIPAFPMDGGRILRSLLSVKLGKVRATKIASLIGRALAIGFVIYGVFTQQLILSLIGLFIFTMAGKEYDHTKLQSIITKTKVHEIMRTTFSRLHLSDTYATVIEKYKNLGEHNFLVFDSLGHLSGTIPELFIKDTIKDNTIDKTVNQLMSSNQAVIPAETLLKDAIDTMRNHGIAIVALEENGQIIGVLDRNDIEKYIRMKAE